MTIETVNYDLYSVTRQLRNKSFVTGSNQPKIIALDPGETTGWALIQFGIQVDGHKGDPYLNVGNFEHITLHQHGQIDCGSKRGALSIEEGTAQVLGDPGLNPTGEAEGIARIMALIDEHPTAAVVIEDFIVDFKKITKDRSALSPVRITAAIRQGLWDRERDTRCFLQDRANAKSSMNDARLKEFGAYQRTGGLGHARDADRHALYFLRRCQNSPLLRFQGWPWIFPEPEVRVRKRAPRKQGQRIEFGK